MTEIGDDEPITLAEACRVFFRGQLTKSSLRTEARKGNLEIIQIANKDFVTRNGIKRMIDKCRKNDAPQGSGSDRIPEHGSSRTESSVSPRIALKQMLAERKKSSQNTSTPITGRSGAVVPLR
ncbi:MAG: hypothetical protein AAAB13_20445 [Pseudomonas sp.]